MAGRRRFTSRELALVGIVALLFGLGSLRTLETLSLYNGINIALGVLCLVGALVLGLRSLGPVRQPALRSPIRRALWQPAVALTACSLVYLGARQSDVRFDWTFEGKFELSPAMAQLLDRVDGPLRLTLYYDEGDPRTRNTYLLLEEVARGRDVEVRRRRLDEYAEDEDRFGIGSSDSVVIEHAGRWALVPRPSEGGLYEGLASLVNPQSHTLYVCIGAGEGDLERFSDLGYSGLRAALENEGYLLRPLPLGVVDRVPPDAAGLLVIAPQRRLGPNADAALRRYLDSGGRVAVFLEPGLDSGVGRLIADYGIRPRPGLVVDPASAASEGEPAGVNPIAWGYASHAVTRGLNRNRMTFFKRALSFDLHKAKPQDRIKGIVFTSGDAWTLATIPPRGAPSLPPRPSDASGDYLPLVVAAELPRAGGEARILAFGDADFASNRYLRALYNLDLVANGIHWLVERESAIGLRPKSGGRQLVQFPVPLQQSISALYGVGLLIPELLLLAGGLVWLRQRAA